MDPNCEITVAGLMEADITLEGAVTAMEIIEKVKSTRLSIDGDTAFIEFRSKEAVEKALLYDGLTVGGHPLRIDRSAKGKGKSKDGEGKDFVSFGKGSGKSKDGKGLDLGKGKGKELERQKRAMIARQIDEMCDGRPPAIPRSAMHMFGKRPTCIDASNA